jgi:DNA-binding transcriptional ArsR family regulator
VSARLEADPVDTRVVKALGHPTRVRILAILRDRELASPVELSNELGVPLGTIGYHVRRLEQLGFIELARRTQRRGAIEHHYRARQLLDDGAEAGGEDVVVRPARGRGAEALMVARAAQAALANGGFDALLAHADRRVLMLDERGDTELRRALARWEQAVVRVGRTSERRLVRAGAPAARRCMAAVMCFGLPADAEDGPPAARRSAD